MGYIIAFGWGGSWGYTIFLGVGWENTITLGGGSWGDTIDLVGGMHTISLGHGRELKRDHCPGDRGETTIQGVPLKANTAGGAGRGTWSIPFPYKKRASWEIPFPTRKKHCRPVRGCLSQFLPPSPPPCALPRPVAWRGWSCTAMGCCCPAGPTTSGAWSTCAAPPGPHQGPWTSPRPCPAALPP